MARIFIDGFETGDLGLWTSVGGSVNSSPPVGFSGTYYYSNSFYSPIEKTLVASKAELYFAFKYMPAADIASAPASLLTLKDSSGTVIASLSRLNTHYLAIKRGNSWSGTLLATGTIITMLTRTYLVEVRYKPLNSGGVFTVKIDGITDIDYSGDATAGLENVQTFRFAGSDEASGNYGQLYIDDIVVDDANWIGNTKVGIIVPDGTGTTNNWTASAGNAWDCLNEKPPSDTDYVYSNTTNQIATYAMTTIASMNSVKCVQLQARAAYESTPTPLHIQLGMRASGADYFATDLSPGVSFGMLSKILELNPADSAAFEQADIDGLELGIKAVA